MPHPKAPPGMAGVETRNTESPASLRGLSKIRRVRSITVAPQRARRKPRQEWRGSGNTFYGLVELFLPATASAAPAPPPATAATIAIFAPVDIPPPPPAAFGTGADLAALLAGVLDPLAPVGASVFASSAEATLRQPPWDLVVTAVTFRTIEAAAIAGRPVPAVPVASTRFPVFCARFGPLSSSTSCVFSSCRR